MTTWDIEKSKDIYNIGHWDDGYFDINDTGHLLAKPRPGAIAEIDLVEMTRQIKQTGLNLPVLVRFIDILEDRVDKLCQAFDRAQTEFGYQGSYVACYPIKVNQQRTVVETIIKRGGNRVGLEAGSKPELLAVLALAQKTNNVIICNGYKDREYIRLCLIGKKMGHKLFIVVEKLSELEIILDEAKKLDIEPMLGVRIRLASIGKGKWQNSGGEKSKFGLSSNQLLTAINILKENNKLHQLKLLHVHLGSQIPNIQDIQNGIKETARYYSELHGLEVHIDHIDVGGGLGVDYEGTRSRNFCSVNYSIAEYANKIVHGFAEICQQHKLPHPVIVTESGRAMTAHHAVLITNVINVEQAAATIQPQAPSQDDPAIIDDLWQVSNRLEQGPLVENYHSAVNWMADAQNMFIHGIINLKQRAHIEQIYLAICQKLRKKLKYNIRAHRQILDDLNEKLAAKYFCNFSLFQSIPDAWAIDQVFPVIPLQRLNEKPEQRGVIEDLTCDSDGRINTYVDQKGVETSLPLHNINSGEEYLLGIFLVGAYQEILGDMHNLFGDANSINVELDGSRGFHFYHPRSGDTVSDVLRYVNFEPQRLLQALHKKMQSSDINVELRQCYLKELEEGLSGYTYFED